NIANESESVWETWNSWGSQTISFEFKFGNNPPILVARGPEEFTKIFRQRSLFHPANTRFILFVWTNGGMSVQFPNQPRRWSGSKQFTKSRIRARPRITTCGQVALNQMFTSLHSDNGDPALAQTQTNRGCKQRKRV